MQAAAVRILNEAFERGTPEVGADYVLERIESRQPSGSEMFLRVRVHVPGAA